MKLENVFNSPDIKEGRSLLFGLLIYDTPKHTTGVGITFKVGFEC